MFVLWSNCFCRVTLFVILPLAGGGGGLVFFGNLFSSCLCLFHFLADCAFFFRSFGCVLLTFIRGLCWLFSCLALSSVLAFIL